jgi:hypothetical protein
MNPMKYPQDQGKALVGYEPPPAWRPPTPEQESLRDQPWIDPTTAFAGGFGANIMRRGLIMGALRGGTAAAL